MAKPDKIILGLRRLAKRSAPGQTYTHGAIAKACGVTEGAIRLIEKKAMERVKQKVAHLHTLEFS